MKNIVKNMMYSRRTFLELLGAAGAVLALPAPQLPASALSAFGAGETLNNELRPVTEMLPPGYEAYVANPNFAAIWNFNRTPPVRDDTTLYWVKKMPDGTFHLFSFEPETAIERADAEELYNIYFHKSWRTFAQLSELVKGRRGPWVIRLTSHGAVFGLITRQMAPRLLAMERIDPAWWLADTEGTSCETRDAALFTSEQVLRLVPRLQATVEDSDSEFAAYYEPVTPEHALKDLRVFALRKSGWSPQVGEQYDLKQLEEIFKPQTPLVLPEKHPFILVPDAWIALIDLTHSPGSTQFHSARSLSWSCGCAFDETTFEYPDCQCLPPAMRNNDQVVISYIFVRKDRRARRYTYLGLGHLAPGEHGHSAWFELVPAMLGEYYQALGGDLRWRAALDDPDGDYRELGVLDSSAAARRCIKAANALRRGCFVVNRWGPDEVKIRFFGDSCVAQARGSSAQNNPDEFLIDPDFSGGDARAMVTLSDHLGELTVFAQNVLPRTMIAPLINQLAKGGDCPPDSANWSILPEEQAEDESTGGEE